MNPDNLFYVECTRTSDFKLYTKNKASAFKFLVPKGHCLDRTLKLALWHVKYRLN